MARQPDVVLIDELAHTHTDGAREHWEDAVGPVGIEPTT
jgi:K+-sensing histidine kinase KdpD